MSWDKKRSHDRIQKHLDGMEEIEVKKLTREADLEQLLSETTCRDIYGAHVYIQVPNFAHLASDGLYAQDDYKRLIQGVHIYQREVTHIVENLGGTLVHFQGPKLHAIFYRPIDNAKKLASRAVLLQLVLKDFVKTVFNPAFPDYDDFTIAGGADLGNAIGTMDGINGDRELLFLGAPANHAAKISEADKQAALRVFHAIRKETARVITGDFDGLRIQYQGDRIQGFFHLPQDDGDAIVKKVVEAAAGLQSSMESTLKACLPEASDLRLAIGIDLGTTLVSKLGARGQRDRICLGEAVEGAAQLEERSEGGQTTVSSQVHGLLLEYLCDRFPYSAKVQGYVATDLTAEQIERAAKAAEVYGVGAPVFVRTGAAGVVVSGQDSAHARTIVPARPYTGEA